MTSRVTGFQSGPVCLASMLMLWVLDSPLLLAPTSDDSTLHTITADLWALGRDNLSITATAGKTWLASQQESIKTSIAWKNSIWGSCNRQKNDARLIFSLRGKPLESKPAECKVNTFIDKLGMWSASDQPWERLSARVGGEGGCRLKSFEYTKRSEAESARRTHDCRCWE